MKTLLASALLVLMLPPLPSHAQEVAPAKVLRIGMIGLDTSHVVNFTKTLHNAEAKDHVPGARVVAAFPGGSPDMESSHTRVEGYTATLRDEHGVEMCESIEELCTKVDVVMLESVDGRPHLAQARPVLAAGLPLYIDKPVAGSLKDAMEIFRLAEEAGVPVFSSSSLRFAKATREVRASGKQVVHAVCSSPATIEPHHPDLFYYGVHGCEALFTVMGTGCQSVRRGLTEDGRIEVIGTWEGGRTGIFREAKKGFSGTARLADGTELEVGAFDGYAPLLAEVIRFFQTGKPPVTAEETLEIFAFMEAADESERREGKAVTLAEMREKAGR